MRRRADGRGVVGHSSADGVDRGLERCLASASIINVMRCAQTAHTPAHTHTIVMALMGAAHRRGDARTHRPRAGWLAGGLLSCCRTTRSTTSIPPAP
jgi:hypothetical protein